MKVGKMESNAKDFNKTLLVTHRLKDETSFFNCIFHYRSKPGQPRV
jgi:hypothetical protein